MKPSDERFTAKTTVLIENVRHHMQEEEQDWFPKARDGVGRKTIQEIGAEMIKAEDQGAPQAVPAERAQEDHRRGHRLSRDTRLGHPTRRQMLAPKPRGELSARVVAALRSGWPEASSPRRSPTGRRRPHRAVGTLRTALPRVRGRRLRLEWHPTLLAVRASLEEWFTDQLASASCRPRRTDPFADSFFAYVAEHDGPSLATFVQREADREQVLELLRVRSLYQLHEADPTTWAIPRLPVRPQAALMALQYDEYGGGRPHRQHAHLFARGMDACELDPPTAPTSTTHPVEALAQNNAMSMFGLHRRWRGAAVGHLAAFEAVSSLPSRQMAQGLRRLEMPEEIAAYYVEHVEADAVHEQLAVREICQPLVEHEPALVDDVFLGAFTCLDLEARTAAALLESWAAERRRAPRRRPLPGRADAAAW